MRRKRNRTYGLTKHKYREDGKYDWSKAVKNYKLKDTHHSKDREKNPNMNIKKEIT